MAMVQQDLFDATTDEYADTREQALLSLRARVLAKRPSKPYVPYKDGPETWHWDVDEWSRHDLCHELLDLALNLPRRGGFLPAWERYLRTYYGQELRTLFDLLAPTYGGYYPIIFTYGKKSDVSGPRLLSERPFAPPRTFRRKYTGRD
jgi:hypothetical protein